MVKTSLVDNSEVQENGFPVITSLEQTPDAQQIKFIMRTVGGTPRGDEIITIEQAENYINSFLREGWKIFKFDVLEALSDGRRMSWLLVK